MGLADRLTGLERAGVAATTAMIRAARAAPPHAHAGAAAARHHLEGRAAIDGSHHDFTWAETLSISSAVEMTLEFIS